LPETQACLRRYTDNRIALSMIVTVKNKTPLVVPPSLRRQAGFKGGDELEFRVSAGVITILPKAPAADEEYTPAQRRAIDRGIARGLEDIRQGRTHGPFATADEAIAYLKSYARQRKKVVRRKTSR
jgi:bifunctional DNA-binding transcriptional regulator/antitoxin component of YhaV-PrlF toxin-antitoxin module